MSEQDPNGGAADANAGGEDRIKNLQAETQRKLENMTAEFSRTNQETKAQLESILAVISAKQAGTASKADNQKLSDLMYQDPDAAIATIADAVTKNVTSQVDRRMNAQNSFNATAAHLENEYPEFRDRTSEHYKRVAAIHNELPDSLKGTTAGLENAALRAASEYGLLPKSKRGNQAAEDFSLGGNASGSRGRQSSSKKKDMSDSQRSFAELLGAPVNDPKFKEVFDRANRRQDWNKYRGEEE